MFEKNKSLLKIEWILTFLVVVVFIPVLFPSINQHLSERMLVFRFFSILRDFVASIFLLPVVITGQRSGIGYAVSGFLGFIFSLIFLNALAILIVAKRERKLFWQITSITVFLVFIRATHITDNVQRHFGVRYEEADFRLGEDISMTIDYCCQVLRDPQQDPKQLQCVIRFKNLPDLEKQKHLKEKRFAISIRYSSYNKNDLSRVGSFQPTLYAYTHDIREPSQNSIMVNSTIDLRENTQAEDLYISGFHISSGSSIYMSETKANIPIRDYLIP